MSIVQNTLKQKLAAGELAVALSILHWRTVNAAGIAKQCGFDWLFIDMEHNSIDLDTAVQICVAALPTGITPIVRVPAGDSALTARVLDGGAMGIAMPHVSSASEAAEVVGLCKYPPLGRRSFTAPLAQLGFQSVPVSEAIATMNQNTFVFVMLETPAAIDQADAIAATPGIDGIMIGTADLTAEMGIGGQFDNKRVEQAYTAVIAACRRHGKHIGMGGIYDHTIMEKYIRKGVRFLLGGSDIALMMSAGRIRTAFLHGLPLRVAPKIAAVA